MAEEISYEQLFDLLRREKTREDLQEIDKDFYIDLVSFLNEKEEYIKVQEAQHSLVENLSLEKEKLECRNMRKILNEIIDRRQKKIILLALSRARIPSTIVNNEVFASEEKGLFENTVTLFRCFKENLGKSDSKQKKIVCDVQEDKSIPEPVITEEPKKEVEAPIVTSSGPVVVKPDKVKVKFLSAMPKFYGPKKDVLGPYEEGQTYELSELIANILIKKGRVVKVD